MKTRGNTCQGRREGPDEELGLLLEASTARSEPRQALPNPGQPCACWAKDSLSAYLLRTCQAQARFPGMPPVRHDVLVLWCCTCATPRYSHSISPIHTLTTVPSAQPDKPHHQICSSTPAPSDLQPSPSSPNSQPRLRRPNVPPVPLEPSTASYCLPTVPHVAFRHTTTTSEVCPGRAEGHAISSRLPGRGVEIQQAADAAQQNTSTCDRPMVDHDP